MKTKNNGFWELSKYKKQLGFCLLDRFGFRFLNMAGSKSRVDCWTPASVSTTRPLPIGQVSRTAHPPENEHDSAKFVTGLLTVMRN